METTPDAGVPTSTHTATLDVDRAGIDPLRKNVFGRIAILFLCIGAIAPAASMLFNVPAMASQAGAATPLVFVLSAIGVLLLGMPVSYFAARFPSAGGFTVWVRQGLGVEVAFQTGWLLFGGYALFVAALVATVGGSLDLNLSSLGLHLPGGWVSYALLLTLVIGGLGYFEVKVSLWVLAPFAVAELLGLLVLNGAITLKGGVAGHDLLHTFTVSGADLKGVVPGGMLGIGIAMTLGILAFVGFETIAVYGEEARRPGRTIPTVFMAILIFLSLLYTWTSYSATIGVGWQQAGSVLGNVGNAPLRYVALANRFVGAWLGVALVILVVTSNFASTLAMHQTVTHYLYSLGREGILPRRLGRTHPRWRSPHIASLVQSAFTVAVVLLLSLVIQHSNPDGSVSYALGIADGKVYTQTGGIASFQWLASLFSMCIICVYILTNVAVIFFVRQRKEFRIVPHLMAPGGSTLLLLLPLASYILPSLPGVGTVFINLGFTPNPFPLNVLPLCVLAWAVAGMAYAAYLRKYAPERLELLRKIIHTDV